MAGNRDRNRVRCTRVRHRAHGFGRADTLGDFRIAGGRAGRNLAQRPPYPLLEGRAAHVEWKIETERGRLDEADHLGHPLLEAFVSADQCRLGKAVLEIAHQRLGGIAEQDGADALVGGGDEDSPERAFADGKADRGPRSACAKVRRCHAEHFRGSGVETPVGIEPGAVDRFGHGAASRQLLAHSPRAMSRRIGFRRDTGDGLEDAMKMKAAHAGGFGERLETGHLLGRLDQAAGFRHDSGALLGEPGLVRPAALAWAESGRFRFFAARMEADVFAPRKARRAGRTAIDARRAHGIIKNPLRATIASHHGGPAFLVVGKKRRSQLFPRCHETHDSAPISVAATRSARPGAMFRDHARANTPALALEFREMRMPFYRSSGALSLRNMKYKSPS